MMQASPGCPISDGALQDLVGRRYRSSHCPPQRHLRRAWANPPYAPMYPTATASTNPPTAVTPGRTWASATRAISAVCACIHATQTWSLSPRWDMRLGAIEHAACIVRKMAAKTWQQVLYMSDKAGAVDLSIDEQNPDVSLRHDLGRRIVTSGNSPAADRTAVIWKSHGRRRHLDRHLAQRRPAAGAAGKDWHCRLPGQRWPRVGHQSKPKTSPVCIAPMTSARTGTC